MNHIDISSTIHQQNTSSFPTQHDNDEQQQQQPTVLDEDGEEKEEEEEQPPTVIDDEQPKIITQKSTFPPPPSPNSLTGRLVAIGLMVMSGCCVALQAGFNATLNATGGRSFAALISFTVGLGCCLLFFVFDLTVLHTPPPQRLTKAPWYAWMGGILGTYYVVINILTVPRLGAATVLSVFVCSQVITACLIDHFGLVQVPKRKYTIWRILASLGLVGCVAVITIF